MKRRRTTWILLIAAIVVAFVIAQAQQPKPEPVIYKLNPEASKAMTALFQEMATENARHEAEVKRINDLEAAMMKGAGIPRSEWDRPIQSDNNGILVFLPKPSSSPTPPK